MSARRWPVLALTLLGLGFAATLATMALVTWFRQAPREGGRLPYISQATDKSLGINADLSRYDAATREEMLAAMEAAGFRWLRHRFPWDAIETEQGSYDWVLWDEIVDGAGRHNLELIAVLDRSPAWSRTGEDAGNPWAPPAEARALGGFAAAFATRYGESIDNYQIWDEPNIAPHWGAREIDPAAYARLLREGAIQIRTRDPGAVVLAAALAPNVELGGANMSELRFLDALYAQGAAEWFDVVAAQPYVFEDAVDAVPESESLNWRRVALLREVMEAYHDDETAVWAVSFGLRHVQPEAVGSVVRQSREDWPWLGPMLWAAWSLGDTHDEYALMDTDGQTRAVLGALQELATAPVVAWPGAYAADHACAEYEGNWRVTPLGADIGSSGDRLTIRFRGTGLSLTVRRGDYRAFLVASVDGKPANALPLDTQGRAYVVLYDPLLAKDTVTLARDLPEGEHVAEIVAERGWGQWAIEGWTVWRVVPQRLPWLPAVLGLAALGVMGATIFGSRPHRVLLLDAISALVVRYRTIDDRVVLIITASAAVLLYVIEGTVPNLVALGLLAVLLILRPEVGLPLIALALPAYQRGKPLLGKVFSMVEILTLLTTVGWLADRGLHQLGIGSSEAGGSRRAERRTRKTQSPARIRSRLSHITMLDWGVLVLVFLGLASLLWAEHQRVAAREYRTVVLEAAFFYGLLRVMVRDGRDAWRVVDAWVLGGALIGLVGVYQWAFGQDLITAEGVWRVRGFYGSPNNLALYLGRVFPLTLAVVALGRWRQRRWLYGLAALVMGVTLFLTYSRGAWLLGVPVSLLFLAALRGRRTFAVAVGVLLVVAIVVVLAAGTGRLTSLLDTTEGTTFFRLQLWQSSWAMLRDHPLLGVGQDNFLYQYRTHYVLPTAWQEFDLSHPHNLVLDFWLRLGLPGLAAAGVLLVAFFRQGWRAYRRPGSGGAKLLALGLMAGMVNLVAHGLVDNAFFLVDLGFAFMLMVALVQCNSQAVDD